MWMCMSLIIWKGEENQITKSIMIVKTHDKHGDNIITLVPWQHSPGRYDKWAWSLIDRNEDHGMMIALCLWLYQASERIHARMGGGRTLLGTYYGAWFDLW